MTLYLRAIVGRTVYLIDAVRISDVTSAEDATDARVVDCRVLFGEAREQRGYRMIVNEAADAPVALIVDRIDGLTELDEAMFRPLPPIGRFGSSIDAVSLPVEGEAPALRLMIGPALFAEAQSVGHD